MGRILCAGDTFDVAEDADVGASDRAVTGKTGSCTLVAAEKLGTDA